jgi:hypothetical protein
VVSKFNLLKPLCIQALRDAGFENVGFWKQEDHKLTLCSHWSNQTQLVYALVVCDQAKYVGVTVRKFSERMRGYSAAHIQQPSNVQLRDLMLKELEANAKIEIFAIVPEPINCQGWSIEPAISLENWMIRHFYLPWNRKGQQAK